MEFTDEPLNAIGTTLFETRFKNKLGLKTPVVFRILKELQGRGYLPPYGCHMAELCMEEAIANAIVHGNKLDETKSVSVAVFGDEERFGVIIDDEGEGFGPEDLPDLDDPEQLLREDGRGVLIVDHYMDEVRYNRNSTRLCMTRRRQTEPDPGAKPPQEPRLPERAPEDGLVEAVEIEPVLYTPRPEQPVSLPDELTIDEPAESEEVAAEGTGPVRVRRVGDVVVAEVHESRIAEESIAAVRPALVEVAEQSALLVLDLSEVEFMASVGIGALVMVRKRIAAKKGQLVLCGVQPAVESVLRMMAIQKIIPIEADVDAAAAKITPL